jgi:putative sigma-54 modulation protein
MKINYTARHTKVSEEMKQYCEKRIQSLEKLLGDPIDADILVSVEKYRQKVEINLKTKMATLNTVEETHDMSSSLVGAFDHLEKRVKKEREKLRERKRRRIREAETYPSLMEEGDKPKRMIRNQSYTMKPLSIEEALVQLETSKEDVFLFRTLETESWAVLYRRKDGNYGLIEPK